MKLKSLLFFCLTTCSLGGFAQEAEERKNDILLDPISLIAGEVFNVSYERILTSDIGIGGNYLSIPDEISQFAPYVRLYFGERYARGFFTEAFVPVTSTKDYDQNLQRDVTNTTIGLGFGIGGKWISKRNFVFEISSGVGRRFNVEGEGEHITGKWMFGFGYRF